MSLNHLTSKSFESIVYSISHILINTLLY